MFTLRFKQKTYHFAPKFSHILLTILVIILFISLGRWQLHRYAEKKHIQDSYTARFNAIPFTLANLKKDDIRYYPLQVSGVYLNQFQILLDNKMLRNKIGYELLTPFLPLHSKQILLIDRGWIPLGKGRQQLPSIQPINITLHLEGIIDTPKPNPLIFGSKIENPGHWPARVEQLDLDQLSTLTGYTFYPFILLLKSDQPTAYVREWAPVNLNPERSLGYAWQWFSFALVLFIIFIVVNTKEVT